MHFFCSKDYNASLGVLNRILQFKEAEMVPDIYRDSRIMQLLAHFSLGNYQLLESLLVSVQRLLSADKLRMNTHRIVLKYVKQYSQKLQKPSAETLFTELEKMFVEEKERIAFSNFDYLYWARKLSNSHPVNK